MNFRFIPSALADFLPIRIGRANGSRIAFPPPFEQNTAQPDCEATAICKNIFHPRKDSFHLPRFAAVKQPLVSATYMLALIESSRAGMKRPPGPGRTVHFQDNCPESSHRSTQEQHETRLARAMRSITGTLGR